MAVCEYLIKQDISIDCTDPMGKGVESEGIIINRSDIDFTKCGVNKNKVTSIVLKQGKHAYKVVQGGKSPFNGTQTEMQQSDIANSFNHTVSILILDNGADVCENVIDQLANGQFVVILENKYKGLNKQDAGSAAYQVYGWQTGLSANEITNEKYSDDTKGGWQVNLLEEDAPKSGMFAYVKSSSEETTDYAATKAMIDSLLETA